MTTAVLTAYVVTAFALVATPGATTTVVIRQAVRAGIRGGVAAAAGAALGNCTHALSAGLGVSVLARRWPHLLNGLTVAGALYLCWLGVSSIARGFRRERHRAGAAATDESYSSFRAGLTVTLLNPSALTFYLTVLPGFMPPGSGPRLFALLAAIHITLAVSCHTLWAFLFSRVGALFESPSGMRRLDIAAGVALIAFGMWVLVT